METGFRTRSRAAKIYRGGPHGPPGPGGFGPGSGAQGPDGAVVCCAASPAHGPPGGGSDATASSGPGSASGPGSWPPANFTSASTRLSTAGWVSKILENPSRGLSMHISITAELAACNPRRQFGGDG